MRFLWYCIQNNQGWGRGYKPKLTWLRVIHVILTKTLIILDITKVNLIIILFIHYTCTLNKTKMEVMFLFLHCQHHKYWFQKFTVCFWPIRKEIVSSMYWYINASNNASFFYISLIYSMYLLSRSASSLAQIEIIPSKKLVQIFRCKKTCNN